MPGIASEPFFGCKRNVDTGEVVPAELMEGKPQCWVHGTYFSRVNKLITRTEECSRRESSGALFDQLELKSNPRGTLSAFIAKYPSTVSTLLSLPDCDFFLELCRTGGKPVNFVPAITKDFKTWFKKASITVVDEPVADILGGINSGFINVVKESSAISAASVAATKQTVDIAGVEWLAALAASVSDKDWLKALISSTHVVKEKKWLVNPAKYVIDAAGIRVFDRSIDISGPVIEIAKKGTASAVVVNEVCPAVAELKVGIVSMEMTFQHHPELLCSIHAKGSGFIDMAMAIEDKKEDSCEAACAESSYLPKVDSQDDAARWVKGLLRSEHMDAESDASSEYGGRRPRGTSSDSGGRRSSLSLSYVETQNPVVPNANALARLSLSHADAPNPDVPNANLIARALFSHPNPVVPSANNTAATAAAGPKYPMVNSNQQVTGATVTTTAAGKPQDDENPAAKAPCCHRQKPAQSAMGSSDEDERKKRSINEMFGDEDSDDSGDEQKPVKREASPPPKRRRDDGDEFDSGEEAVATKEDDDFIDRGDDLADVLGEYDDDRQQFDDERPLGGEPEQTQQHKDDFFDRTLKSLKTDRSRTKLSLSPQEMEQITQEVLYRMDKAYADDLASIAERRPALEKIKFVDSALHPMLLDLDLLTIVKKWIQPLEDGSLPNVGLRTKMLQMVSKMTVVLVTFTADFSITKEDIVAYRAALGLSVDKVGAPTDFFTIVSWRPLIKSVFTKEVKGNLMDLVHLNHSHRLLPSRKMSATFIPGDDIPSTSNVSGLHITVGDQLEEVLEPLVELHGEFLIRGSFNEDVEILKLKSWPKLASEASVSVGDNLSFELTTKKQYALINSLSSVEVSGVLCREEAGSKVEIGTVELKSNEVNESPGVAFLRQVQPADANAGGMFANGGSHVPESPVASRNLNPIHRSKYAAILGHLRKGKPIMHGLASVRFDSNVVDYDVNFDGMVYPDEKLFMQARHIGLDDGKKVLSVEVVNGSGEDVVSTRAVMKQAPMAFVFPGQGSAAVNMGMDRYQESSVACEIWNRGDMVHKNPKSIMVHFGVPGRVRWFLNSFVEALSVEALMDLVFLRAIIMQKAVKRGHVDGIEAASGKLLQIVNFNIQQRQYVVAGENVNLQTLSLALAAFKALKSTAPVEEEEVIAESLAQARARKEKCEQSGRPFTLSRDLATTPLVGIDVPFHSRELLGGVPSFRAMLRTKFDPWVLERQLSLLVNRYIPNPVATPFSLERSYFEEVYQATKSPFLAEVLDPMQLQLTTKAQPAHLLVVELLAYQFAVPVQWIKTQALLFS
ncbi:hypothetical protein PHYSODRAFT_324166 [Phytophthora sojae]|uniref:Fatty acid synthase beta subunit AflB /Fas1-like central domain-containing protein n=1 Tax=Phytophthora sojae (strain P6497) TaxID=1094619 RepID=G4YRD6_PHYSP|nr:hypothetical protein PHYSODRAFT_324166 [Phytophthora sojae]EGZ22870.1 hypothetical protein PHYSODRAFT_324166 [Phytophthora sojae]|eukprot:XP_009518158.1 hypothetical protein PHYSODRAFT_324166 [Phytophthora sojae]